MKKHIAMIAALSLLASITVSCGKDSDSSSSKAASASTTASTETTAASTTEAASKTTEATTEKTTEKTTEATTEAETEPKADLPAASIDEIAGIWQEIENGAPTGKTLTINADGTFDFEGITGKGEIAYDEHPDGTASVIYKMVQDDGEEWLSFYKSDEQPQLDLYSGQDGAVHFRLDYGTDPGAAEEQPNEYGFYPYTDEPREGTSFISINDLEGEWLIGQFTFKVYDCERLTGKFDGDNESGHVEGVVKLEYTLDDTGAKQLWYNLYESDGKLYKSYLADGSIPVNELQDATNSNANAMRILREEE